MTQPGACKKTSLLALVALGANLAAGNRTPADAVRRAMALLDGPACRLVRASRLFHTPCFPAGAGPDYVNAVVACETSLAPGDLLARLHAIEADMGRERVQRWGNRTIDLDLLALGDLVLPDPATFCQWRDLPADRQTGSVPDQLILPHPRLAERAFVLVPLLDIAPDWRHPVGGRSVAEMASALPEADRVAVWPAAL